MKGSFVSILLHIYERELGIDGRGEKEMGRSFIL